MKIEKKFIVELGECGDKTIPVFLDIKCKNDYKEALKGDIFKFENFLRGCKMIIPCELLEDLVRCTSGHIIKITIEVEDI